MEVNHLDIDLIEREQLPTSPTAFIVEIRAVRAENATLTAALARCVEALTFYGDEQSHKDHGHWIAPTEHDSLFSEQWLPMVPIDQDKGNRARLARGGGTRRKGRDAMSTIGEMIEVQYLGEEERSLRSPHPCCTLTAHFHVYRVARWEGDFVMMDVRVFEDMIDQLNAVREADAQ